MTGLPSQIILEVTRRCNYRCPFCYCTWHELDEKPPRELGTAAWREIIAECAARGVRSLLFTGGEALLRPDIYELLAHARKLLPQGDIEIFTNGSRVTDERLRWLKRRRIRIATSLQGLRTYGEMTGTRRSFRTPLKLAMLAAELKWPVSISITVNKANLAEAADMFVAATLAKPRMIQMGAVMAEGRARDKLDMMLTPAEWEELKQRIRNLPDCRVPYTFCDEFYCRCRDYPKSWEKLFGVNASECSAGKDFGVIGPAGKFRKCLHTVAESEWRQPPSPACSGYEKAAPSSKRRGR